MTFTSSAIDYEREVLESSAHPDSLENNAIDRVFTIAQEIRELLHQSHAVQSGSSSDRTEMILIRAIEPKHREIIGFTPLTARELEVLQLIVAGCNNSTISENLCVTVGTVKTHVRNILGKFCVSDRTQAAIRALRAGLVQ